MGPETFVCDASYEELFLFKLLCEELKLSGVVLRNFDFKLTRSLITQEPFSQNKITNITAGTTTAGTTTGSTGSGSDKQERMSLETAKIMLRTYAKCLNSNMQGKSRNVSLLYESNFKVLLGDQEGVELWNLLKQELDFMSNHSFHLPLSSSDKNDGMDFMQFVITLQRLKPEIAIRAGWFKVEL